MTIINRESRLPADDASSDSLSHPLANGPHDEVERSNLMPCEHRVFARAGRVVAMTGPASKSAGWLDTLKALAKAPTTPVLLMRGGTGTAKRIHRATHGGKRAPFVHVDCARLREQDAGLLLFGAETGTTIKKGFIERANGGTLFLDNIEMLPESEQAMLADFLDRSCFRRVHGKGDVPLNLRVVAQLVVTDSQTLASDLRARFRLLPSPRPDAAAPE